MNVGIVGLGLIGGSLAKALKYKTDSTVWGLDNDKSVLLKAKLVGAVDDELSCDRLKQCDMVIIALYPKDTIDFVKNNIANFKDDAIVIDSAGVKQSVCDEIFPLVEDKNFTFIGGHPMAGRHFSGFEYSQVGLFENASMILVPPKDTDIAKLDSLKKFFLKLGFDTIKICSASEHDKRIAYTSQLAHVVSNAYVKSESAVVHGGFSAGSYKDLTRVAKLNPAMWSELFLSNKKYISEEIDSLLEHIVQYKKAIDDNDETALFKLLEEGSLRKEKIDGSL